MFARFLTELSAASAFIALEYRQPKMKDTFKRLLWVRAGDWEIFFNCHWVANKDAEQESVSSWLKEGGWR